ncbi:serine/threonine protein kinase [Saccharomycopsis crataegensis]|uniref:Serine/threonine protein kinase n=1 Tax=Saccharomycopsis crataegensis TaxID=43959 RepID=A0AAV5QVF8_9ASCO|nr:serine/threonine protein kinase [Saccharomycopsis crataegensis]
MSYRDAVPDTHSKPKTLLLSLDIPNHVLPPSSSSSSSSSSSTIAATTTTMDSISPPLLDSPYYHLSPPTVFNPAAAAPLPQRTRSIGSNKSVVSSGSSSTSPLKRSDSLRSNNSSLGSPVVLSITGLPSPITFESPGRRILSENHHSTIPMGFPGEDSTKSSPQKKSGLRSFIQAEAKSMGDVPSLSSSTKEIEGNHGPSLSSATKEPKGNQITEAKSMDNGSAMVKETGRNQITNQTIIGQANVIDQTIRQANTIGHTPSTKKFNNSSECRHHHNEHGIPSSIQVSKTPANHQRIVSTFENRIHPPPITGPKKIAMIDNNRPNDPVIPSSSSSSSSSSSTSLPQKRFFSTPLPRDSTLISAVLNHDSKFGTINDSAIKREQGSATNDNETIVVQDTNTNQQHAIFTGHDLQGTSRRWGNLKVLGKGSFSTVFLGKLITDNHNNHNNHNHNNNNNNHNNHSNNNNGKGFPQLAAVKVTEFPKSTTPQDSANRARLKSSLQRELEIMMECDHLGIIKCLATGDDDSNDDDFSPAYNTIMLTYCPGGDLFEFASTCRSRIRPFLLERIFAEVVAAISYLHSQFVVHRDIKLENVLVNIPIDQLLQYNEGHIIPEAANNHNNHHRHSLVTSPIITITDFGLSKKVDPSNILLETRCGSEDYVAPELLMGMPYDGRQTDTWALGVLLYALMEGRLPFDPPPPTINPITGTIRNPRVRSRTAHRIARIEWNWYFFKEENGEEPEDPGMEGNGGPTTESLLSSSSSSSSTKDHSMMMNDSVPNSPTMNHYQYRYDKRFWSEAKKIIKNTLIKRDKRWTANQVLHTPWCWDALPRELKQN